MRRLALPAGPLLAVSLYFFAVSQGSEHALAATLGMTGWCALWWVLEPVRAPVTALLPLALEAGGIPPGQHGTILTPRLMPAERARILGWWKRRRRLGKPLNLLRLVKASTTFEGAARYAAWKIERHTGMPVKLTPFRERYPLLAAPQVLLDLRRHRRGQRSG